MYAMILAAGRGERMRPLTDTLPKPLLCVNGKPLIVYHIEKLAALGITNIVINQAWLGHKLPAQLGDGQRWGVNIHYVDEGNRALETAGGIKNALTLIKSDCFIVVNGDVWSDFNFSLLPLTLPKKTLAHLIMVNNPTHNPEGDFALDGMALRSDGANKYTFSGIGLYHRDLFELVTEEVAPLGPLLRLAMSKNTVEGQHHGGLWTDVGTPERLATLDRSLADKINQPQGMM